MDPGHPLTPKCLGYWISAKKFKRLSISDIEDALRDRNISLVRVDLKSPLSDQGKFDGFLHKLTDVIARADDGDEEAQRLMSGVETYIKAHPSVVLIDPIDSIRTLINRYKTYSLIQNYTFETKGSVFVPPFFVLESNQDITALMRQAKVTFPVVCKPIVAHGSMSAHEMTLVFNDRGFSQCQLPCVVQSFVNHNAVLYKLFGVGEESFLAKRPSIKNLFASEDVEPIHFHSGEISKAESSSLLTLQKDEELKSTPDPCPSDLRNIAKGVHKQLNIGLFGVDVVLEPSTGRYAIIDINVFPGYDGVPDFPDHVASYIRQQLDKSADTKCLSSGDSDSRAERIPYVGN